MSIPAWTVECAGERPFIASHPTALARFADRDAVYPGRPKLLDPRGVDRSGMARNEIRDHAETARRLRQAQAQANRPREGRT